jgi:hypothetical protein
MKHLTYLFVSAAIYLIVMHLPVVGLIAQPINILCTFLHEFGHAFFAIITGGSVKSMAVNMDGSGVTYTMGGNAALLTMGGYVGSALFGNIMLRLADTHTAQPVLKFLAGVMFVTSLIWFDNFVTTGALMVYAVVLWYMSNRHLSPYILSFLGVACIIYIIQDFNVGPTSDLQAYESEVGLFPAGVWMYIWLMIVIAMTSVNLYGIIRKRRAIEEQYEY